MTDLIPFIVIGAVTGAVYGLSGLGLVLTYKTSGVFNFAHGALATISAYTFYVLHVQHGIAWPVAAAIAVVVVGPILGLLMELLARSISRAGLAIQVVSTVGVLLAVEAGTQLIFGTSQSRVVPVFLTNASFNVGDTIIQWSDAITFLFATAVTIGLAVFLRTSRLGMSMRGVVNDPELLALHGISPLRTRRSAWVIGTMLVAASGVLFAPLLPLDPIQLTLLIIAAFGAAAIGAFSSLPMTLAGGLGIGVLASLCTKWFSTGLLAGAPPSLPFIVLFVVLLVFPKRKLVADAFIATRIGATWRAPAALQLLGGAILLGFLVFVPGFAGIHLTAWTIAVASTVTFLSLSLLVRTSGQVSLAQISFTAIGAAGFSHLAVDHHFPWLVALLAAGLLAVPVGAVLAIPAIRLTGLYLALATFGFGLLLQGMFYTQSYMFGSTGLGLQEPRPHLSWLSVSSDKGFYYVVLVIAVLAAAAVIAINRSRLGRLARGIADSPLAISTSGAEANMTRLIVFCMSGFLAAIGGALAAVAQNTVSADSYQPLTSLTYFVLIMIAFGGEPWSSVIASGAFVLVPSYLSSGNVTTISQLVFGCLAIIIGYVPSHRRTLPLRLTSAIDSVFARKRRPAAQVAVAEHPRVAPGALEVADLRVTFGGLVAVDDISLQAPTGRITGLIGPNGAGKTTTFNACSGLLSPSSGTVRVDGDDVTRRGVAYRARLGIGRTFQRMALVESQTVLENVAVSVEAAHAGFNPINHVLSPPGERREIANLAHSALAACGLAGFADRPVSALSTGQRRLVELARCVAGDYHVLLLDEPSSGLDEAETREFGRILSSLVAERDLGILLVEHDMTLVLGICDLIYVVDFGKLIFVGTPDEVMQSDIVRSAYLGGADIDGDVPTDGATDPSPSPTSRPGALTS